MKKAFVIITIILTLMLCIQVAVFAEETETMATQSPLPTQSPLVSSSPSPSPTQMHGEILTIDNANIYSGMDKPYNSGYLPTSANGVAHLILPLKPTTALKDNTVNVMLNLGDATSSPFVFGNYDKSVTLQNHAVTNGTSDSYLIDVTLPLSDRRKMGRYPVVFSVSGQTQSGQSFSQSFTLYVTITDGIDPDATLSPTPTEPTPTPEPTEAPLPQAKVLITNYSITPNPVMAGEEFTLTVTFQNTNENQSLNNVKVTAKGETTDIIPVEDSSFYFKKVAKKDSFDVTLKMKVRQDAKPVPQKLLFKVEYENSKAVAFSADEEIVVQLKQPIRIEYDPPKIPKEVNAGDTISVSMNVLNMGKSTLYNVRVELAADGIIPDSSAFIGNMESGTSKKGDIYAFIGTKDMTSEDKNAEKYGQTSGNITISYEDEYGESYTEEVPFNTMINPPVIEVQEEEEEEKPQTQSQWWISVIIAGGIIVAIVLIMRHIKKKKLKEYEDEAN